MLTVVGSIPLFNFFWVATITVGIVYVYLKFVIYAYWEKLGVAHTTPSLPFGNALAVVLGKKSVGEHLKENYGKFKKHRFSGMYMFHKPVLMINDPELIRQVLVTDFNVFHSRGLYINEQVDPLMSNLFLLSGEKWKRIREKLTPTFTASKMKDMFPLVKEISDELIKTCDKVLAGEGDIVEIKDLIGRYTIDTICSIAFGFNCNSLDDRDNEFKRYASLAFDMSPLKIAIGSFAPIILDVLRLPVLNKKMSKFFTSTFQHMIKYRRQSGIVRKDFLNLLMQLMDKGVLADDKGENLNGIKLSMVDAQAQAFIFLLAGFETTSSTITYLLYELALNPQIQDEVHREMDKFLAETDEVTYNRVKRELPYLDMAFFETMRKHSSLSSLNRVCVKDWRVPDTDIEIKKGTGIVISVSGLHHDPDIYPDPEKFDPTRFSQENVDARSPYVYLPFGAGPKICIGTRFGMLQSKLALLAFLSKYKLHACEKTVVPLDYSKKSFVQRPACGVYLRLEKRQR